MRNVLVFCILIVFAASCATAPGARGVKFTKYISEPYPATHTVDVLHVKPISRDCVELGQLSIRLKRSTEENAVLCLKEKAKEIGADAIVILGETSGGSIAVPIGSMYAIVHNRYLNALAIKYK